MITVGLDARVLLLAGLVIADPSSAPPDFQMPNLPITAEARRRFEPLAAHPAVRRHAKFDRRVLLVDRAKMLLESASPLPRLAEDIPPTTDLVEWAGGAESFAAWREELRDFARASDVEGLAKDGAALLNGALPKFDAYIRGFDSQARIEAYTGLPFDGAYAVVLNPFSTDDTGGSVTDSEGRWRVFSLVPFHGVVPTPMDLSPVRIFHELTHGTLDVVTNAYRARIEAQPGLREGHVRGADPRDWFPFFREHLNDVISARLAAVAGSERTSYTGSDPADSPLLARLAEYEARRDRYPTLAHFYPRLLELGAEPPASKPPRLGRERRKLWLLELAR